MSERANPARRLEPPARAVLDGVRRRDAEALGAFFDHYFERLWSVAYRFLGDRALAEEAVQEMFLKVHRAADRLDPARDPGPWLFTVAYNTCRDVWRSTGHRIRRASEPAHELSLASGSESDPAAAAAASERQRRVRAAILALPESLRMVVLLHDVEGLDHREIATVTGLSHDAVRKRYSRALEALGDALRGVIEP